MESIFIVQHLHILANEQEDIKFIGAYRSRASALAAVERLSVQHGFSGFPKVIDPVVDGDEQALQHSTLSLRVDESNCIGNNIRRYMEDK